MNSRWHLYISIAKSALRIISCIIGAVTNNIIILAIGFGIAEILGILEELKDDR